MNLSIFGAGAWGTAMAIHLSRQGHTVTLVPRRSDHALALASERENRDYLRGFALPPSLQIGDEPGPVLMETEAVLLACPSHALRTLCEQLKPHLDAARSLKLLVTLCKGLEKESWLRPTEVVEEVLPGYGYGGLSGPSFAVELAQARPTAITFASCAPDELVREFQEATSSESLRVYRSTDIAGVELGGSLKNIYAVAAGASDGLKLGDNARAALLTRSLAEMVRLGTALGGQASTFYGLSGFGDLVVTCTGASSRNRGLGYALGQGESLDSLLQGRKTVVEGYHATPVFRELCQRRGLEAPILEEVYGVLYEGVEPRQALRTLMSRELKAEG